MLLLVLLSILPLWSGEKTTSLGTGLGVGVYPSEGGNTLSSYSFSYVNRVKVLWVDFILDGSYRRAGEYNEYGLLLGAGFSADLWQRVRLGLQIGPRFKMVTDDSGVFWYYDKEGMPQKVSRALDVFAYSPVAYHASCDVLLGPVTVDLFYDIETKYRFASWENIKDLIKPDWDNGKFGVAVLYQWK